MYYVHIPSLKDEEELENNGGGSCVGVKLAGPGHKHGPRHPAQVPQSIGVHPAT